MSVLGFKNKVVGRMQLSKLQTTFAGHDAWIFGSSVKGTDGFSSAAANDVDMIVVVGTARFDEWKEVAYDDEIITYEGDSIPVSTKGSRRVAAQAVLGVHRIPKTVDVFLFPEEFVAGNMSIPAWDRRFKTEVLRDRRELATLKVATEL